MAAKLRAVLVLLGAAVLPIAFAPGFLYAIGSRQSGRFILPGSAPQGMNDKR